MKPEALEKLAFEIADEDSESTIDCQCVAVEIDGERWFDTKDTASGSQRWVDRAVKYLEARGLLERRGKRSQRDIVRVLSRPA